MLSRSGKLEKYGKRRRGGGQGEEGRGGGGEGTKGPHIDHLPPSSLQPFILLLLSLPTKYRGYGKTYNVGGLGSIFQNDKNIFLKYQFCSSQEWLHPKAMLEMYPPRNKPSILIKKNYPPPSLGDDKKFSEPPRCHLPPLTYLINAV